MRRIAPFALALASLLAMSSFATGCAADEAEEREAAYPAPVDPVGTTPPNELGDRARPPPPPDEAAPTSPPPGAVPPGAPPSDVGVDFAAGAPPSDAVVGDDDGTAPGTPADAAPDGSDQYADTDPSALNDFRSTLDPYGSWVQDPNYGTVWVPSPSAVGDDFTPYVSDGHWTYDDGYADNYVWVSDYAWGWAPFHYGRWAYASRGWSWIPGRQYAGAWVSWRYGEGPWGYVGWAPLAPTWGWRGGSAVALGFSPRVGYSFVSNRDLFAPGLRSRVVVGPRATLIGEHTQPWVASRGGVSGGFGGRFGPPPSVLNISAGAVVRTSGMNRDVMQARAFARPSTGRAYGASAPQARMGGSWTYRGTTTSLTGDAMRAQPGGYASTTHFGGRLGGGFAGSPATSPIGPRGYPVARPSGGFYSGGTRTIGGGYSGGPRSFGGGAAPRPMSMPGGGFHAGGSVGGAVHGGGSVGGGGGFHGGGGGGFHGGGHGGRR
ncbi:MAG TPA: DUF6600 domain-containing protein [Polyangiaceae bacterium]|nr:DUF6600 domain-containing protein [Polyangiaceae bacterium]